MRGVGHANGFNQKVNPRGLISRKKQQKLTRTEAEVLSFLQNEGLTVTQIALRRKTSKQAVYKIRERLITKGYFNPEGCLVGGVSSTSSTFSPSSDDVIGKIRLHAQQFRIGIIQKKENFEKIRKARGNIIPDVLGCHVVVHSHCVEVYAKKQTVFYGVDEWSAMAQSMDFFQRVAVRLENDLDVVLVKAKHQNWEMVKAEWATEGSEVAKRHLEDNASLEVRTTDDGRVWFKADWSNPKGDPEHEAVHRRTGKPDSEEVNKHLNDWRDFKPPTNSQLAGALYEVTCLFKKQASMMQDSARLNRDTTAGVNFVVSQMKSEFERVAEERKVQESMSVSLGRPPYVG